MGLYSSNHSNVRVSMDRQADTTKHIISLASQSIMKQSKMNETNDMDTVLIEKGVQKLDWIESESLKEFKDSSNLMFLVAGQCFVICKLAK